MMVKINAIDFLQILGAVLNLPASQSIPILLKESRIGFADYSLNNTISASNSLKFLTNKVKK